MCAGAVLADNEALVTRENRRRKTLLSWREARLIDFSAADSVGKNGQVRKGFCLMNKARAVEVRILKYNAESVARAKDEEYEYWQSRPPVERLQAMQELSFAFFEARGNEAEIRRQFLRSAVSLPRS